MGTGCCSVVKHPAELSIKDTMTIKRLGNFSISVFSNHYKDKKKTGAGYKETPAWVTDALPEEVHNKREEFWETRTGGCAKAWESIKAAIEETNSEEVLRILTEAELSMVGNSLMLLKDDQHYLYEVPPYVINEPERYGRGLNFVEDHVTDPARDLEIYVRSNCYEDWTLNISNFKQADELKNIIAEHKQTDSEKFRIFYNGREIKGTARLAAFRLKNKSFVQVFYLF